LLSDVSSAGPTKEFFVDVDTLLDKFEDDLSRYVGKYFGKM
jgi:hypothetical protein